MNLLSRKFIYSMIALIGSFVLAVIGKITGQQFLEFATAVGAIYSTANVVSQKINK